MRAEINSFIWLTGTALGASILLWNRMFISLWVGADHSRGALPDLLIVISAVQLALIRSDGNVINLTLRMSQKVLLGLLSVAVSIAAASVMVGYFKQGLVGLCLGTMAGRLIISIGYPMLISRNSFGTTLTSGLKGMLRPVLVSIVLFAATAGLDSLFLDILVRRQWMGVIPGLRRPDRHGNDGLFLLRRSLEGTACQHAATWSTVAISQGTSA